MTAMTASLSCPRTSRSVLSGDGLHADFEGVFGLAFLAAMAPKIPRELEGVKLTTVPIRSIVRAHAERRRHEKSRVHA
jgi:hypothetical protein